MPRYVALLRAVNVGGTGKLPMTELKAMCIDEGFADAQTYIASGNVVFSSKLDAAKVKAALERRLQAYTGKPVGVVVRSADEIAAVLRANPFPKAPPNYTVAIFFDEPPPKDALKDIKGQQNEEVRLGKREIYVAYGSGMGRSKLKIPAAAKGTARNINTIAKLAELAAGDNEG
ncbi:DUF1697 domain-containing protein [Bradyrhizobium australafricanum]|uniref:DUF1697 domain-containing protein n=1 Tax=Bradyrhizobium australafricanum TaxID=2821406 RepID=UPI001CE2F72B|nr:DUF1697 domain-containing protein [Bradyrhizobium australafricanum]MCA6101569.1 DUF1697 domain-containing protein [Bradyrhizobium australafricanum]